MSGILLVFFMACLNYRGSEEKHRAAEDTCATSDRNGGPAEAQR